MTDKFGGAGSGEELTPEGFERMFQGDGTVLCIGCGGGYML